MREMWPFMRDKLAVPHAEDCLPGRSEPMSVRSGISSTAIRLTALILPALKRRFSGWAASGAPSACFGRPGACGSLRSATPAARRQTRPRKRCAAAAPDIPRRCSSSSTQAASYEAFLKLFWESHDPTQGMRQGNNWGTQYRSAIYTFSPGQRRAAEASRAVFQPMLETAQYGAITTEIADAPPFYFAEDYHQQYLAKNPRGYCGLGGTGATCPIPAKAAAD